jgi:prepilin-type N-terminal cleavage/methylation domain-containing protein
MPYPQIKKYFSFANKGFSLVEIAVAIVVIGLIIGAIIQGVEIARNQKVNSLIAQIKEIDSALISFKDTYGALPGDFSRPNRIANCNTPPCNRAGNRNTLIESTPGAGQPGGLPVTTNMEVTALWAQLSAADLLGGYILTQNDAEFAPGVGFPVSPFDSAILVAYWGNTAGNNLFPMANYLSLYNNVQGTPGCGWYCAMRINEVIALDEKLDDGSPIQGIIRDVWADCNVGAGGTPTTSQADCINWNPNAPSRFYSFIYQLSAN